MIRKVCAFGLLLLLVTAGYSIAAKPDKPTKEEQKSKQDKAAKQDNREKKARGSKRVAGAKDGSTYNGYVCLEQLWQDYPGDDDLYAAAYYGNGCENEPTWELWYGTPNPDLEMPQTCDLCEGGYGGPQSTRGANVPPHKLKLDKENSWRMLRAGLEAADISTGAMSPEYYTIPKASLPAGMQAANPNGIDIVGVELPPPPKQTFRELNRQRLENGEVQR